MVDVHIIPSFFGSVCHYVFLAILTIPLWLTGIPLIAFFISVWVKTRGKKTLPHLRNVKEGDKKPVLVGFFHPYCNAGGGGERVLWIAIKALQNRYPHVKCVVYTGDTDATGSEIVEKAQQRFNITGLNDIEFVFLNRRKWVEAKPYPMFTLLGQSLGSLVLGWEAMMKFVPDIYIDTMGYAFTLPLFKYFGGCKVACYVHYPTISTDMLQRVSKRAVSHNNADYVSKYSILTSAKLIYYHIFAYIYGVMGRRSNIVMVNSTWTQNHILSLWQTNSITSIVYPPCDTSEFLRIPLKDRTLNPIQTIVSIAQFRPEKDHAMQIRAFDSFLIQLPDTEKAKYRLFLIGSCRNDEDMARVDKLKKLCNDLDLNERVEFKLNVSFEELKKNLGEAAIGLHTMWNEHFGIGVVELMAAGTITLAHNSGGPKMDIVVEFNEKSTGFLADSVETYAEAMKKIFSLPPEEQMMIRENARASVTRFSHDEFEKDFLKAVEPLFKPVS